MRARRRRRPLSLTSLIDVIFLLLLFFMLSSTFSKFAEIPLPLGGAGQTAPAGGDTIFLRLAADSDGMMLNGRVTALDQLGTAITDQSGDGRQVIIATTQDTTSQRLVDVLAILRSIPETSVNVLVPS